ncbi:MAG: ABC transporter ATP-binding protein [Proteobacteria bacterium]|nr:ABC transporter ATP-binding protein [Pseudomonadota bacterium]
MIELKEIRKSFFIGNREIEVLKGINIKIYEKESIAIIGQSGSGKTTLMNIIGCMDRATSGTYLFKGKDITTFNDDELSSFRNESIGFVFQQFHLIPYINALDNVILPTIYSKKNIDNVKQKAISLLTELGMHDRIYNKPTQLSGGQQQRVAIARALINDPEIILADEPTGALDTKTSSEIMDILTSLNEKGKTIIIITHEQEIANRCKKIIRISDGKIV